MYISWMYDQKSMRSQLKWYRKIIPFFKHLGKMLYVGINIGFKNVGKFYTVCQDINAGKYKNADITEEARERYQRLFGGKLFYTIKNTENGHSEDFEHIANAGQRDDMVKALGYYILRAYNFVNDVSPNTQKLKITSETINGKRPVLEIIDKGVVKALTREGADDDNVDHVALAFREVFTKEETEEVDEKGKKHKIIKYPKFDALSKYVRDYIASIISNAKRTKIIDDDTQENSGDVQNELEEIQNSNIEKYDKLSFEFSKLESVTERVKVFFGTIHYTKLDEEGKPVMDYSKNQFNVPSFYTVEEVFSKIVKYCNDCITVKQLNDRLCKLAQDDLMFMRIFKKFHFLVYGKKGANNGMYKYDENGNIVDIDYDRESMAIQILSAVSSQKIDFLIALSRKQEEGQEKGKSTLITTSSMDRDSKQMPRQWTQYLLSGQVGVFKRQRDFGQKVDANGNKMRTQLVFVEGMGGDKGTDVFSRTASFFSSLMEGLSNSNSDIVVDGNHYNKDVYDDVERLKEEIIHRLKNIGIIFQKEALDNMLLQEYGGTNSTALNRWLQASPVNEDRAESAKLASINSFISRLNDFVSDSGIINQKLLEEKGYTDVGFVISLAKWQGDYNHTVVQRMAYGLNGKKLNSISQNNSISHIINALNTNDLQNDVVKTLCNFGYNISNMGGFPSGSIILKALKEGKLHINAATYLGFKTDNRGDQGSEYTEEATVEDYIAKMSMLQQGYLIFPTLADKGTWMVMKGVDIPGMTFIDSEDESHNEVVIVKDAPSVQFVNGEAYLVPNSRVINQMIEYANTERLAIQRCMEDLGYEEIPDYTRRPDHTPISENAKIKNYHTPNKDKKTKKTIEPNGTRFLSLTKIVIKEYDKAGKKYKLVTYNLNDPRMSSVDCLKLANEHFFSKSLQDQADIMALTLAIQNRHEVETAVQLGIVDRVSYSQEIDGKTTWKVSSKSNSLMNLDTKQLNLQQVKALTRYFMTHTKTKDGVVWSKLEDARKRVFYEKVSKSLAIAAILGDATNRHIISSQEVQRCFSGHPAEFKVDYDVQRGLIKDSAYDIQKRIGGMVSTGDDNILDLPGLPSYYTCAECKDYEVGSAAQVAKSLDDMFISSQVRHIYGIKTGDWDRAYSEENIDNLYTDELKDSLDKAKKLAQKFGDAYKDGINVADGAAYITEQMCENLLRMRGAYSGKVKEAFKLLRDPKTMYDWKRIADAYKTIYDAVNIVSTKYTAYGFRPHTLNGDQVSDVAVAYYNKFALFPLFACISTGKMDKIYKKMQGEGVDMLFMTSAVKVGSQGAVSFDGESINDPFNTYTQSYSYLRRQLNTDPEEGSKSTIGSQMIKIGLQNLILERNNYIDSRTGKPVSGEQILKEFMGSINKLSEIGVGEVIDMFYTDGKLDPDKLSEYLKSQLTTRNANKTIVESIEAVDSEEGGRKLKAPLSATSDATWIESIMISTINKKVIDIQIPGSSFVQRSVFAIEGSSTEGGLIQGDENMDKTINNGERLEMINDDGSMDAVISMDYFDDILFVGVMKDWSFDKKRQWLIENNIIGKHAKANTIGYRIPTQAQSSIHALRFVDVISAVKSTIILPQEFTKITGSDFDIDHLYLASYNYNTYVSEDGEQVVTTTFNPVENEGQYQKQYYQNKLLDSLMTLLKDTQNSINSLYKSIDNDTELITNISDLIPETGSTKDEPYNFGTLHEQVIRKNDYITGKKGIGPYALNVTNQVLTQLYGVKFRHSRFTKETGIESFDHLLDFDDNSIASWLSAFINAHVDIVKDPYISRLNVNPFTYNMCNLLIRSGWGSRAVWFLAQPIIRDMAEANNKANSQYAKDPDMSKNGESARDVAIYNAVLNSLEENDCSEEVISAFLNDETQKGIQARIDEVNWIRDNQDILAEFAKNPNLGANDPYKEVVDGYSRYDVQKHVFLAWKCLEKYSIALGDFVQHTKVDTRKYGKNLISARKYLNEYNELFHPQYPAESIWDVSSLRNLETGSWIGYKTINAILLSSRILGNQTFNANDNFIKAVLKLSKLLAHDGMSMSEQGIINVARSLQTAIKSEYFVKYAREKLNMSDEDIAGLFVGNNSMNRRLVRLKYTIENNPKYKRLADNSFLNQIYSVLEDTPVYANGRITDRPGFVTVLDNVDQSKVNSDSLSDGWLDLLNDDDKFIREFARQMILYAFFSSGEFKGWNKLMKYVPAEWILGQVDTDYEGYGEFIERKLNEQNDYEQYFDDIIANNFMDYKYVKRMRNINDDNSRNFINTDRGVKIGKGVKANQLDDLANYITVKKEGVSGRNQDAYDLYKLVGTIHQGKMYYPVYAKIKKRGYHTKGFDIYEYGWNFNYAENEVKGADNFDFDSAVIRVTQLINSGAVNTSEADQLAVARAYLKPEPSNVVQISQSQPTIEIGLTNPFNNMTVEFRGTKFDNAEHAYQTWKSGKFDQRGYDAHGGKVKGTTDFSSNFQLMVDIITAKLQQHPELIQGIKDRGGEQYISNSTHDVVGDKYWETVTGQNKFIEALLQAYKNVTESNSEKLNVSYDWQYLEDSGYSGVLEERGNQEYITSNSENVFYTKQDAWDYIQDLKSDGKDISKYRIVRVPATEDEDEYYTVTYEDQQSLSQEEQEEAERYKKLCEGVQI